MDSIRFQRNKRSKSYIIPLIVIVLLYLLIPILLISKGEGFIDQAIDDLNSDSLYSPPIGFYNGHAFLQTAESFPGFSKWARRVAKSSYDELIEIQDRKFKQLCLQYFNYQPDSMELDSIKIDVDRQKDYAIIIYRGSINGIESNRELKLDDSLINLIDSAYCKGWNVFFKKFNVDSSKINPFCRNYSK